MPFTKWHGYPPENHRPSDLTVCVCCAQSRSHAHLCHPRAGSHQAPLSMGFPRQGGRSGLPLGSPQEIFPSQGLRPN